MGGSGEGRGGGTKRVVRGPITLKLVLASEAESKQLLHPNYCFPKNYNKQREKVREINR